MNNKQIAEEMKIREHDPVETAADAAASGVGVKEVLEGIQLGVVDTYESIERSVVGTYQKVEDAVVGAYQKVEDSFVEKFLAKPGETVEEAKERLTGNK